jgi:hypothetical protein
MRIFTVIAAAAVLALSVAVAYAHEPPEWTSEVRDEGGPPGWVDDVKSDGGSPGFVEAGGSSEGDDAVDEVTSVVEEMSEGGSADNNANAPEWVDDVRADGGPPAWVEDVKANGGPPAWVAEVRTAPAAATSAAPKKAGR